MATIRVYESEGYPYCIREDEKGNSIDDSQKIWWPFNCEDMTLDETRAKCREHFPEDRID